MAEGGGEFVGEADPRGTPGNEGQDGDEKYGGLRSLFSTPLRAYREATTRLSGTVRAHLRRKSGSSQGLDATRSEGKHEASPIADPLPSPGSAQPFAPEGGKGAKAMRLAEAGANHGEGTDELSAILNDPNRQLSAEEYNSIVRKLQARLGGGHEEHGPTNTPGFHGTETPNRPPKTPKASLESLHWNRDTPFERVQALISRHRSEQGGWSNAATPSPVDRRRTSTAINLYPSRPSSTPQTREESDSQRQQQHQNFKVPAYPPPPSPKPSTPGSSIRRHADRGERESMAQSQAAAWQASLGKRNREDVGTQAGASNENAHGEDLTVRKAARLAPPVQDESSAASTQTAKRILETLDSLTTTPPARKERQKSQEEATRFGGAATKSPPVGNANASPSYSPSPSSIPPPADTTLGTTPLSSHARHEFPSSKEPSGADRNGTQAFNGRGQHTTQQSLAFPTPSSDAKQRTPVASKSPVSTPRFDFSDPYGEPSYSPVVSRKQKRSNNRYTWTAPGWSPPRPKEHTQRSQDRHNEGSQKGTLQGHEHAHVMDSAQEHETRSAAPTGSGGPEENVPKSVHVDFGRPNYHDPLAKVAKRYKGKSQLSDIAPPSFDFSTGRAILASKRAQAEEEPSGKVGQQESAHAEDKENQGETKTKPAAGWDPEFLAANKRQQEEATKAVEQEIAKEGGSFLSSQKEGTGTFFGNTHSGSDTSQPGPFSFGFSSTPVSSSHPSGPENSISFGISEQSSGSLGETNQSEREAKGSATPQVFGFSPAGGSETPSSNAEARFTFGVASQKEGEGASKSQFAFPGENSGSTHGAGAELPTFGVPSFGDTGQTTGLKSSASAESSATPSRLDTGTTAPIFGASGSAQSDQAKEQASSLFGTGSSASSFSSPAGSSFPAFSLGAQSSSSAPLFGSASAFAPATQQQQQQQVFGAFSETQASSASLEFTSPSLNLMASTDSQGHKKTGGAFSEKSSAETQQTGSGEGQSSSAMLFAGMSQHGFGGKSSTGFGLASSTQQQGQTAFPSSPLGSSSQFTNQGIPTNTSSSSSSAPFVFGAKENMAQAQQDQAGNSQGTLGGNGSTSIAQPFSTGGQSTMGIFGASSSGSQPVFGSNASSPLFGQSHLSGPAPMAQESAPGFGSSSQPVAGSGSTQGQVGSSASTLSLDGGQSQGGNKFGGFGSQSGLGFGFSESQQAPLQGFGSATGFGAFGQGGFATGSTSSGFGTGQSQQQGGMFFGGVASSPQPTTAEGMGAGSSQPSQYSFGAANEGFVFGSQQPSQSQFTFSAFGTGASGSFGAGGFGGFSGFGQQQGSGEQGGARVRGFGGFGNTGGPAPFGQQGQGPGTLFNNQGMQQQPQQGGLFDMGATDDSDSRGGNRRYKRIKRRQ